MPLVFLLAEIRLLMKFHKRFDLDKGDRPRIEILDTSKDYSFHDIMVLFPEKQHEKK